jgi:Rrf2 family transcriptional repressor of oqxAB
LKGAYFDAKEMLVIDVRFPTALQLMLSLALAKSVRAEPVSSTRLAEGVGSHPTFVRRLLVPLIETGLVTSSMGRAGGLALGRPSEEITLCDIYDAVMGEKELWPPRSDFPHQCLVSSNFSAFFGNLAAEVDAQVRAVLARQTLAESFAVLGKLDRKRVSATTGA